MSAAIAQALEEYAEELEEASEGTGVAYLVAIRDKCLAMLSKGEYSAFVNTTVNGQTFSAQVQIGANDMFNEVSSALRQLKGRDVKITYGFVSNIPH